MSARHEATTCCRWDRGAVRVGLGRAWLETRPLKHGAPALMLVAHVKASRATPEYPFRHSGPEAGRAPQPAYLSTMNFVVLIWPSVRIRAK